MRAVLIAALVLFAWPAAAQEETRTHRFFEGVGESVGWVWNRGKDAVSGLGDATEPSPSGENRAFVEEHQQEQRFRDERLERVAGVIRMMGDIPVYCRQPSAIELWPAMPDQCLRAMDEHLAEVEIELGLIRNEIRAEMQMGQR